MDYVDGPMYDDDAMGTAISLPGQSGDLPVPAPLLYTGSISSCDVGSVKGIRAQSLLSDGVTPRRPMNAFMIFSRHRRPAIQAQEPGLKTGEISKRLSTDWKLLSDGDKSYYLEQARILKDEFHTRYPDYVYQRRPNNAGARSKKPTSSTSQKGKAKSTILSGRPPGHDGPGPSPYPAADSPDGAGLEDELLENGAASSTSGTVRAADRHHQSHSDRGSHRETYRVQLAPIPQADPRPAPSSASWEPVRSGPGGAAEFVVVEEPQYEEHSYREPAHYDDRQYAPPHYEEAPDHEPPRSHVAKPAVERHEQHAPRHAAVMSTYQAPGRYTLVPMTVAEERSPPTYPYRPTPVYYQDRDGRPGLIQPYVVSEPHSATVSPQIGHVGSFEDSFAGHRRPAAAVETYRPASPPAPAERYIDEEARIPSRALPFPAAATTHPTSSQAPPARPTYPTQHQHQHQQSYSFDHSTGSGLSEPYATSPSSSYFSNAGSNGNTSAVYPHHAGYALVGPEREEPGPSQQWGYGPVHDSPAVTQSTPLSRDASTTTQGGRGAPDLYQPQPSRPTMLVDPLYPGQSEYFTDGDR